MTKNVFWALPKVNNAFITVMIFSGIVVVYNLHILIPDFFLQFDVPENIFANMKYDSNIAQSEVTLIHNQKRQQGQRGQKPITLMKSSNPPGTICLQENNMKLLSTLFLLLLSTTLVLGQLQQRDRTTREPRKGESMEERKTRTRDRRQRSVGSQGNPECQEGNPLGASYLGSMNVTTSGRTCQAW